jgi:hypothetical protein
MPRQWDGKSPRICPLCGRTFTDGGFVIPTDPELGDSFTYCRTCHDADETACRADAACRADTSRRRMGG